MQKLRLRHSRAGERHWGEVCFTAPKPQPESRQGLLSDRETWEAKSSLAMVQMLFKWLGSYLSGSWFCRFRLQSVCLHFWSLCRRQCVLAFVTWLPGSQSQETRVSVNAEACQRQVPALLPMPGVQQLGKGCEAHSQVWAVGIQHQLEFPASGGSNKQASLQSCGLRLKHAVCACTCTLCREMLLCSKTNFDRT